MSDFKNGLDEAQKEVRLRRREQKTNDEAALDKELRALLTDPKKIAEAIVLDRRLRIRLGHEFTNEAIPDQQLSQSNTRHYFDRSSAYQSFLEVLDSAEVEVIDAQIYHVEQDDGQKVTELSLQFNQVNVAQKARAEKLMLKKEEDQTFSRLHGRYNARNTKQYKRALRQHREGSVAQLIF